MPNSPNHSKKPPTKPGEAGGLVFRTPLRSAAVEEAIAQPWMRFVWWWFIDKFVFTLITQADNRSEVPTLESSLLVGGQMRSSRSLRCRQCRFHRQSGVGVWVCRRGGGKHR